jgi:hypothetical protein
MVKLFSHQYPSSGGVGDWASSQFVSKQAMDSEDGDVLAAGRFPTQCNPGKGRPTNRPRSMAPKSRNVESATISCYWHTGGEEQRLLTVTSCPGKDEF